MAILEADTLFYRDDHPGGYLFSAGGGTPDPADGWVATPEDVVVRDAPTFECTTFEAYEQLLKSERTSSATLQEQVRLALARVGGLEAQIAFLTVQLQQAGVQPPREDA